MHTQMDETTKWKPNETWIEMKENSSTTTGYARIVRDVHKNEKCSTHILANVLLLVAGDCDSCIHTVLGVGLSHNETYFCLYTDTAHTRMRCELFATVTFCTIFS